MDIKIELVTDKSSLLRFIRSQWNFYRGDPNFVPPLIADRAKLLNKEKNPFFKHSDMQLFMATRNGDVVGRIAAIQNGNHNKTHNDKVGFFGFFECVNEQPVADALFEAAANWLRERGLTSMRGPEDPSQNDELGLLIEGFDRPPVMLMKYNPQYYIDLIEKAGLTKAKDLYAWILDIHSYISDKLERMQSIVRERYKVTIREVNFKDKQQFKRDVDTLKELYNSAWQPNWGFVKMTEEEFDFLAADLKSIADSRLTYIAEIDGKPAGFALGLPDINQALIYNKRGGLLGAAWHLLTKKKKIDTLRIIVLGVKPEYQRTGIDAVMYYEMGKRGLTRNILYGEASWVLEDNAMMNRALETTMLGKIYKKYRLYEKTI